MFLYVKNRFNPDPEYALKKKRKDGVYLEYLGAPSMLLPRTVEELKKSKSAKYWYNLKRSRKLFEDQHGPLTFEVLSEPAQIEAWMPKVFELLSQRWRDQGSRAEIVQPGGFARYQNALLELARSQEANLAILRNGDTLLAFSYNLLQSPFLYYYQHATANQEELRKFSLGKLFLAEFIEWAVKQGDLRILDFMVGENDYKTEWADFVQKVYYFIPRSMSRNVLGYTLEVFAKRLIFRLQRTTRVKAFLKTVYNILLRRKGANLSPAE